jgi:2-phospho-L-lactate guanylyltransferase
MTPTSLDRIVALVPVRSLGGAKSRLGEPLDPEERADLVLALLRRTVEAALAATRLAGVIVVSMDEDLLRRARAMGAATLLQKGDGLNAGLDEARLRVGARLAAAARLDAKTGPGAKASLDAEARSRQAAEAPATAVLVLPADLPGVTAPAIDRLVETAALSVSSAPGRPVVALVPDRHGTGTNALLVAPPHTIPFSFGEGSRAAHAAAAGSAGASYLEVDGPLTFDVDTPEDLLEADVLGLDREVGR